MGEETNEARDALIALLDDEDIRKDVGVANFLIDTYANGAALPGDILNWAVRFDIEAMVKHKTDMQALLDQYSYLRKDIHVRPLEDSWSGEGASAFIGRWSELAEHVGSDQGLAHYLEKFTDDLGVLIRGAVQLQKDCASSVEEKLKGLRRKYCEALIAYANGEGDSAGDTFSGYAGTGGGIGAITGGPLGIMVGSLLGGLVGIVNGFNDHVSAGAEKELAKVDTATEFKDQLQERARGLTGSIGGDSTYSRGGGAMTKWDPSEDDVDGEWDPT